MIKISSFAKAKSNSNGNNNASSGGVIVPTVIMKKTPNVRIWGQWHDHTGDVNGDMTVEGKIDVTGDITTQSSVIGKKGDFEDIVSKTLKATDIQSTNIVSDNGFINNISSSSINTDSIDANYGRYDELVVENLVGENGTFHNLTVTGKAHFFELVIDKITASGGAVIFSPADGFEVEKVIWVVNSSTDYLNIPSDFILPTNYHLIDYNNLNYTRAVIDVGGNKSNAFVVRPYNTTLDMDWYYFWETGELMRQDKIVELKYPDLYGQYSVIETAAPKYSSGVYNYKYEIVEEDTNEYLYNLSYPDGYALIDYKKLKISVCGHDIDGNRVEVDNTIKYATKVWVDDMEQLWLYEENKLVTDLNILYSKYANLWQSYTRTYKANITTGGISKSYFTLNPYLLFLAENEQGRAIRNEWQVNDQAICRNFNEAKVGSSQNVKNKYYWGLVVETDYIDTNIGMQFDQIYIDKDGNLTGDYLAEEQFHIYHAIALDATDYDGVLDCEPGDAIAMLGNRKDKDRQKAIYISSYTSLDPSLEAPLFAQYEGINTYSLDKKKTTWFAANGNKIQGKLVVENGKTVEDLISDSEGRTNYELQKLIEKYNNWLNNVEDDLAESYLKALPTTKKVAKTYNGWKQAIGTTVTFETITIFNQSTQKHEVIGQTNQFFPSLSKDDRVAVEVTINQSYQDSTMPNKGTVLGTVLRTPVGLMQQEINKVIFRTTVRIEYIIDADLSQVWLGMSQLKVEQDSIKMTVTNLGNELTDKINQGIASLEIRAGQIESKVDNLQGDVSSITQQADNIQLQVNELAIKIDGQNKKIVLDGDTEVNGTVNINKDGTGFKLSGSNGETFTIGSDDIGTFDKFYSQTINTWIIPSTGNNFYFSNHTIDDTPSVVSQDFSLTAFFGKFISGQQINICDLNIGLVDDIYCGGRSYINSITFDILQGSKTGTQRASITISKRIQSGGDEYINGDKFNGSILSFTVVTNDFYYIRISGKVNGYPPKRVSNPSGGTQTFQPASSSTEMRYTLYVSSSVNAFGKLTYNGFGFNFGEGKSAFIGSDQVVFNINPKCGIRLSDKYGLQKLVPTRWDSWFPSHQGSFPINGGEWIGINDLVVRTCVCNNSYGGAVKDDGVWHIYPSIIDDMLIITELPSKNNLIIHLPLPEKCVGKVYYVKNVLYKGDGNVYVCSQNEHLTTGANANILSPADSHLCNDNISKKWYGLQYINHNSMMYIAVKYNNLYRWISYYCG